MSIKKGIDISAWQEPALINYDLLAKEIDFAILRASYTGWGGAGDKVYKDEHFEVHYKELTKRGVPVGAYHYGCADTVQEAINEARFFLQCIQGKTFAYPVYYDTEDTYHQAKLNKTDLTSVVIGFLQTLEAENYFVGVYASFYWFNNNLDLERLKPYHKWVAHWSANENPLPSATMWQTSSKGSKNGYKGNLDLNTAFEDFPSIIKNAKLNGFVQGGKPLPSDRLKLVQELQKQVVEAFSKTIQVLKDIENDLSN